MTVAELYEPLIERDIGRIRTAVAAFRSTHSSEELFLAVARFAILAYAPSQHAKHATLAAWSAYELRDELGEQWDELLLQCAIYAAQSRQPWSEPPLPDPPALAPDQRRDLDELREAIAEHDRLRGERWLAARIDDDALLPDLFTVASEDFEDLGHKLIVANAAAKLSAVLGEKGRFATLRIAVWEMVSQGKGQKAEGRSGEPAALLERLIDRCIAEKGSIESAHAVFLFDAAVETGGEEALAQLSARSAGERRAPIYALGRDYAAYLKSHAVAKRLRARFPNAPLDAFVNAVGYNLEHAPSFEEWSFA